MKFITITLLAVLISLNGYSQSSHGIGIELVNGPNDDFQLGLRYEYNFSNLHGAKLAFSYGGSLGLNTTVGYQYKAIDFPNFRFITGLDYTVNGTAEDIATRAAGDFISIPLESRFRAYKNIWLNIGLSPAIVLNNQSENKFGIKNIRLGAVINF